MRTVIKALSWICGIVGAIVLLGLLLALVLPSEWTVTREVRIEAPISEIHPYVNDFRHWWKWSQPFDVDPTLKYFYEGASTGVCAVYRWEAKSGNGRMEITRSEPERGVWYRSAIGSEATNGSGALTYEADRDGTRVRWSGEGKLWPIIGGIFAGSVEGGIADYYDYALNELKKLVESNPTK